MFFHVYWLRFEKKQYLCDDYLPTDMFGFNKKKEIKRLLAMRFSAMGDVAMTVPVLHALATQHPELRITMLTRTRLVPLYDWMPANVQVQGVDFDQKDGAAGLTRLYMSLRSGDFDAVADLHDVLRTKFLRTCFKVDGTRVAVVDKRRKDRHALIGNGQTHEALRPMTERYADVFRSLGLDVDLTQPMHINLRDESFASIRRFAGRKQAGERWVGVAPFAAHAQKIYPLDRMEEVVRLLTASGCRVFLFGAGKTEREHLEAWAEHCPGAVSVCGQLDGLRTEMLLMSQLDLMLSMDSANMHIASLMDVPVLSIWGATHPKAGFLAYGQSLDRVVQLDLPCRPCSIYGNKPCRFGDLRCMDISPDTIARKALSILDVTTAALGR